MWTKKSTKFLSVFKLAFINYLPDFFVYLLSKNQNPVIRLIWFLSFHIWSLVKFGTDDLHAWSASRCAATCRELRWPAGRRSCKPLGKTSHGFEKTWVKHGETDVFLKNMVRKRIDTYVLFFFVKVLSFRKRLWKNTHWFEFRLKNGQYMAVAQGTPWHSGGKHTEPGQIPWKDMKAQLFSLVVQLNFKNNSRSELRCNVKGACA